MMIELLATGASVVIAVVVFALQLKGEVSQMKKDMMEGFTRHREEHQEHHKEIAKMFEGACGIISEHITEERVRHAEEKKEHEQILHYIQYHTCEKCRDAK